MGASPEFNVDVATLPHFRANASKLSFSVKT